MLVDDFGFLTPGGSWISKVPNEFFFLRVHAQDRTACIFEPFPELGALVDGDVPISVDTRSLYSVALDWLGGPTEAVLGATFDRYGILK